MSAVSLTAVFATCVWVSCVVVGVIGIVIPYAMPQAPKTPMAAIQAEILNVALTTDPIEADNTPPPVANAMTPPPASKPMVPPSAPALIPVAAPNPAIAYELSVAGPTRVVEAKNASYSAPGTQVADAVEQPVAQLTFGRGEGKQPAPTYPARALNEGQEGTVRVQLTVGPDGRPLAAEIVSQSPWPLLNEAALKVVRERWRFASGAVRRYEVPIHFKIRK
jgi:protein TonB